MAYSRFVSARDGLSDATRFARELVQLSFYFTRGYGSGNEDDDNDIYGQAARKWRGSVARWTGVLLRAVAAYLEYPSRQQETWKLVELSIDEKRALLDTVGAHSVDRTPLVLVAFLRTVVASSPTATAIKETKEGTFTVMDQPLHVNRKLHLLSVVSDFVKAFQDLVGLAQTPLTFSLVHMTRTIVFAWVFTLPFALSKDMTERLWPIVSVIFFVTYGFLGLERVAIQFDDPFGDDPCDLNVAGLVSVVLDDIAIVLHDVDGPEAAQQFRAQCPAPTAAVITTPGGTLRHRKRSRISTEEAWGLAASTSLTDDDPNLDWSRLIGTRSRGGTFSTSSDSSLPPPHSMGKLLWDVPETTAADAPLPESHPRKTSASSSTAFGPAPLNRLKTDELFSILDGKFDETDFFPHNHEHGTPPPPPSPPPPTWLTSSPQRGVGTLNPHSQLSQLRPFSRRMVRQPINSYGHNPESMTTLAPAVLDRLKTEELHSILDGHFQDDHDEEVGGQLIQEDTSRMSSPLWSSSSPSS